MDIDLSSMTNGELDTLIKRRVDDAEKNGFFRRAHQVAAWAGAGQSKRFEYGSCVEAERDWGRFTIDAPSQNNSSVEVFAALGAGELRMVVDYSESTYFNLSFHDNYIIPGPWIDAINEMHPYLEAVEKREREEADAAERAAERTALLKKLVA